MPRKERKIRVMIATLGLEPHWRGAVTVAGMLRDLGMEVIYIGNAYPEGIVRAAVQEDVDVIGVSCLTGAHLTLGSELLQIAEQERIRDKIVFAIGGVFPPRDVPKLREIGFDAVFGPGARGEEIHSFVRRAVTAKADEARRTSSTSNRLPRSSKGR
jgi:methylmalonyl-CoA mutase C-terminal domain/subunit